MNNYEAYRAAFKEYPDVVSVEQMSEMLGISIKSAYQLVRNNTVEHFKVGRTYRIPKLHILQYLRMVS